MSYTDCYATLSEEVLVVNAEGGRGRARKAVIQSKCPSIDGRSSDAYVRFVRVPTYKFRDSNQLPLDLPPGHIVLAASGSRPVVRYPSRPSTLTSSPLSTTLTSTLTTQHKSASYSTSEQPCRPSVAQTLPPLSVHHPIAPTPIPAQLRRTPERVPLVDHLVRTP